MSRRRLLAITIFLLLGAIINIATGWACTLWVPFPRPQQRTGRFDVPEAELALLPPEWRKLDHARQIDSIGYEQRTSAAFGKSISAMFVRYHRAFDRTVGRDHARVVYRCGWPLASLQGHVLIDNAYFIDASNFDSKTSWHGAYPLRIDDRRDGRDPLSLGLAATALPYRPILLGFAVNTLLFSAFLAAPFLILAPVRRRLRLRASLCPRCRYPMSASPVCTECGHTLPAKHAAITESGPA